MTKDLIYGTCHDMEKIDTQQIDHLHRFVYKMAGKKGVKRLRIKMILKCLKKYPDEQEHILKVKRVFYHYDVFFIFSILSACLIRLKWRLIKPVLRLTISSR